MTTKDFTVIIPMYNAEIHIEDTLDGILTQSAIDNIIEIIVVDDGSTDNSASVVQEKQKNSMIPIILIKQENSGVSKARNNGVKLSKTSWIAFCDSDDKWEKNKLQKQIQYLDDKKIKFIGTGLVGYNPIVGKKRKDNLYSMDINDLLKKTWPQTSTVIMTRELFDLAGGFPLDQNYGEDGNLWISCLKNTLIYYVKEELVNYCNGKNMFGVSGLSGNLKKMHEGVRLNIKHAYELKFISKLQFTKYIYFEQLKYIRRIIIRKIKY